MIIGLDVSYNIFYRLELLIKVKRKLRFLFEMDIKNLKFESIFLLGAKKPHPYPLHPTTNAGESEKFED
jgi:hypothetical protein